MEAVRRHQCPSDATRAGGAADAAPSPPSSAIHAARTDARETLAAEPSRTPTTIGDFLLLETPLSPPPSDGTPPTQPTEVPPTTLAALLSTVPPTPPRQPHGLPEAPSPTRRPSGIPPLPAWPLAPARSMASPPRPAHEADHPLRESTPAGNTNDGALSPPAGNAPAPRGLDLWLSVPPFQTPSPAARGAGVHDPAAAAVTVSPSSESDASGAFSLREAVFVAATAAAAPGVPPIRSSAEGSRDPNLAAAGEDRSSHEQLHGRGAHAAATAEYAQAVEAAPPGFPGARRSPDDSRPARHRAAVHAVEAAAAARAAESAAAAAAVEAAAADFAAQRRARGSPRHHSHGQIVPAASTPPGAAGRVSPEEDSLTEEEARAIIDAADMAAAEAVVAAAEAEQAVAAAATPRAMSPAAAAGAWAAAPAATTQHEDAAVARALRDIAAAEDRVTTTATANPNEDDDAAVMHALREIAAAESAAAPAPAAAAAAAAAGAFSPAPAPARAAGASTGDRGGLISRLAAPDDNTPLPSTLSLEPARASASGVAGGGAAAADAAEALAEEEEIAAAVAAVAELEARDRLLTGAGGASGGAGGGAGGPVVRGTPSGNAVINSRCALCRSSIERVAAPGGASSNSRSINGGSNDSKCRNCWRAVCDECVGTHWARSMVPSRYTLDSAGFRMRICKTCDTATEAFRKALLLGQTVEAMSAYSTGCVNLDRPYTMYHGELPVHCAAAGGNVGLLSWLLDEMGCRLFMDNNRKVPIRDLRRLTVLGAAAVNGQVQVMRYLVNKKGCSVSEIRHLPTLKSALKTCLDGSSEAKDGEHSQYKVQSGSSGPPASHVSGSPTGASSAAAAAAEEEEDNCCIVCFDSEVNCTLIPCGHHCCCVACASKFSLCPVCRTSVQQKIQAIPV